jgi:hypothetical protein
MTHARHRRQEGFALFVIAALFMAFALIAAAIIDRTNASRSLEDEIKTREQLSRITYALIHYALEHDGRYPCPANHLTPPDQAEYGNQVTGCQDDSNLPGGGSGSGVDIMDGAEMLRGAVPFKSLITYGITPEDVLDLWDDRIAYHVARNITADGDGIDPGTGKLPDIRDYYNGNRYHAPYIMLVSYGPDRMGAYDRYGVQQVPCDSGSNRIPNCDKKLDAYIGPMNTNPNVSSDAYFDDIISFGGR